jgi:DNA invertase Pin-like site-specific DNA recombinase
MSAVSSSRAKGRRIGYARVSTDEQNLRLQIDALRAAGCEKIFQDEDSVAWDGDDQRGLARALWTLGPGDVLVVWRLDRLGRSLKHVIELIHALGMAGRGFRSLCEEIDTDGASGQIFLHVIGALVKSGRALIAESTKAGLQEARMRGKRLGRPAALSGRKLALALCLKDEGLTQKEIARACGVSVATLYRVFREAERKGGG